MRRVARAARRRSFSACRGWASAASATSARDRARGRRTRRLLLVVGPGSSRGTPDLVWAVQRRAMRGRKPVGPPAPIATARGPRRGSTGASSRRGRPAGGTSPPGPSRPAHRARRGLGSSMSGCTIRQVSSTWSSRANCSGIPAKRVAEQALVGPRLVAELLLEVELEVHHPQGVGAGLLRFDQERGAALGVDPDHQLVGLGHGPAGDADGGWAVEDHADLGDLRLHALAGAQVERDAGPAPVLDRQLASRRRSRWWSPGRRPRTSR